MKINAKKKQKSTFSKPITFTEHPVYLSYSTQSEVVYLFIGIYMYTYRLGIKQMSSRTR